MNQPDAIWYKNISVLWKDNNLQEFFPTQNQSTAQQLNAVYRLAVYISILLTLYHGESRYLLIVVIVGISTYYIYENSTKELDPQEKKWINLENFEEEQTTVKCTKPTLDNPFMNFTMKDYMNISEGKINPREPACDINDPEVKKESDDFFNNNLYRDVDDIFGKMNSQRQFFTMPWTTIPPDEKGDFKNWLYNNPKTCKESQDACYRYEDLRSNRFIFPEPEQNPTKIEK